MTRDRADEREEPSFHEALGIAGRGSLEQSAFLTRPPESSAGTMAGEFARSLGKGETASREGWVHLPPSRGCGGFASASLLLRAGLSGWREAFVLRLTSSLLFKGLGR